MNKKNCTIWGREFNLPVSYDVLDDEPVLDQQKETLEKLLLSPVLSDVTKIKEYCIKTNPEETGGVIDNIFRVVMPTTLFVKRNTKKRVVAILCNYRYDEENGIAVVFENESIKKVGPQDIIL